MKFHVLIITHSRNFVPIEFRQKRDYHKSFWYSLPSSWILVMSRKK